MFGYWSNLVAALLNKPVESVQDPKDRSEGFPLKYGDRGPDVTHAMKALADLGMYDLKIDDIYGPGMRDAVSLFEEAHAITPVDGNTIDVDTWRFLMERRELVVPYPHEKRGLVPGIPFVEAAFFSSMQPSDIITGVVIHWTGGKGDEDRTAKFFASGNRRASTQFAIGRRGGTIQCVRLTKVPWATGPAKYLGSTKRCSARTLNIELCNVGYKRDSLGEWEPESGWEDGFFDVSGRRGTFERFPAPQITALIDLIKRVQDMNLPHIQLKYITTHYAIAPKRKSDAGPLIMKHMPAIEEQTGLKWLGYPEASR